MDMNDFHATTEDIYYAYRLLLGREPDAAGSEHYQRMLAEKSLTPDKLAEFFLGSSEFAARHNLQDEAAEVDFDGYSLYVRRDDHDIGMSVMQGVYEPHVTAVVKEVLRPGDTFVDVGANIGYFAALGAHLVGPTGHVVAIEPMDKNVQLISATVWRNRFANVEVLPYAASASARIVPMVTGPRTSNGEVVRADPNGRVPALFAQARRLDDMLRDLDRLDLIKFDIEGHELLAWRGFAEGIVRHRPLVLTEFHPKCMRENAGVEPTEYLDVLFGYAESVHVLRGPADRVPCRNVTEVMAEWEAADRRLRSGGTTHLDLFVRPKGR
jgi:FkbM family methyltransferase